MSGKTFAQVSVLVLVIMAFFAVPSHAQAGGVCGGTFIVERGETLESIAATCGTTVSAITAANPGIGGVLSIGQVVIVPGINYTGPNTPTPVPASSTPGSSTGTYIVRSGDTFSEIAKRFGVSINALWAANPSIQNINLLYVGQTLNIPGSSGIIIQPVPTEELVARSWGTAPKGTAYANVRLSNKSKAEAYVSLQGTTKDGFDVINEYPVDGTFTVRVPSHHDEPDEEEGYEEDLLAGVEFPGLGNLLHLPQVPPHHLEPFDILFVDEQGVLTPDQKGGKEGYGKQKAAEIVEKLHAFVPLTRQIRNGGKQLGNEGKGVEHEPESGEEEEQTAPSQDPVD